MKTLASPAFFRTFDLLLAATNPGLTLSRWTHDEVEWERERHSYAGRRHGFAVEAATLSRGGRRGWTLLVVKEFWWFGNRGKEGRASHWAQLLAGRRNDVLDWMREQERALENDSLRQQGAAKAFVR